jgi:hypothetical protein
LTKIPVHSEIANPEHHGLAYSIPQNGEQSDLNTVVRLSSRRQAQRKHCDERATGRYLHRLKTLAGDYWQNQRTSKK